MWRRGVSLIAAAMLLMGQTGAMAGQATLGQGGPTTVLDGGVVLTLPAGTQVPLTLVSAIKSKSTKVGDLVRGQVAFPVTVGETLAIPAGGYVEGVVTKLAATPGKRKKGGAQPQVAIHFTRLLYANGYTVALDANSDQARVELGDGDEGVELAEGRGSGAGSDVSVGSNDSGVEAAQLGFGLAGQEPAPLPQVGPSPAVVGGAIAGGMAAVLVGVLVWAHHRGANEDVVLLDAGWQFAMVTVSAVTLDGAKVRAAAAVGN